jgi:predicted flap endonuclease-1-like 5' DNA nuclease
VPGEKIRIHVKFDQIPDRYRLQILDQRKNSRLNRYGKGSNEGILLEWPIPLTIRKEHLGLWQINIEAKSGSFNKIFFVEQRERIEPPMLLSGPSVFELEQVKVVTSTVDDIISLTKEPTAVSDTLLGKTPVTAIKGIGKTYAGRLTKISVSTISDFTYYPDRVYLAEIMRVSDSKLGRMLQDAEILLSQEADTEILPSDVFREKDLDSLREIRGIGPKSIEKLRTIGIFSKSDLINFEDLESLRKTLRMSIKRVIDVLISAGKVIAPVVSSKPERTDPLIQSVTSIKGIGVKTAQRLNFAEILTVSDLAAANLEELASKTSFSMKRLKSWQVSAKNLLK